MPSRNRYREVLENVYRAHLDFKKEFHSAEGGRGKNTKGRRKAEAELEEFRKHLQILNELLEGLRKSVQSGSVQAIDDLMEYLAVDHSSIQLRLCEGEVLQTAQESCSH